MSANRTPSSLVLAASGKKPPTPPSYPKGYRPSLRQFQERVFSVIVPGDRPASSIELRRSAKSYFQHYGRYPNRGQGLKYTSGPGVNKSLRQKNATP
jgi:hypothetical protein